MKHISQITPTIVLEGSSGATAHLGPNGEIDKLTMHYQTRNERTGKTHGFTLDMIRGESPEAEHERFLAAVQEAANAVSEINVSGIESVTAVAEINVSEPGIIEAVKGQVIAAVDLLADIA